MYGIVEDDQEAKFKVGQRVRVVKGGYEKDGSFHGAYVGQEDTIIAGLDKGGRYEGNDWFYAPHEIELVAPTKFKAGDRVVTNGDESDVGTVRGYRNKRYAVQFDSQRHDASENFIWGEGELRSVDELQPAFLPGDKVRVTKHSGYFAIGDTGEVESQGDIFVHVAHGPYQRFGLPIEADKLELIAEPEAGNNVDWGVNINVDGYITGISLTQTQPQPCIVALTKNGQPLPATRPYIHADVASATQEAERLARNNPGQEFAVYQRVAGRVAEVHVEMKEVA